jgi:uncharacterized protein (TIGR02001 family)
MKTLVKAIAIASLASTAAVAQAEVTGSLGVNSSYMFRGEQLNDGMTTSAGIGFELAGISVGVLVTDADDSDAPYGDSFTETDITLGYTANVMGTDVRFSYTDYAYNFGAGDDDRGQTEFSVGITASGLALDFVSGEDTDMMDVGETDYDVITLGYTVGNVDITLGQVDIDDGDEYNYYEISTGTELFGLDAHVMVTNTFSQDNSLDETGATLVVGLSKSLNL